MIRIIVHIYHCLHVRGGLGIRLELLEDVERYYENVFKDQDDWAKDQFRRFCHDLLSEADPFPCVLGVQGLKMGELEFTFVPKSDQNYEKLAGELSNYARTSRTYGRNTSFVAFFEPDVGMDSLEQYEKRFWNVLNQLHDFDNQPWPNDIPKHPDDALWEFSFMGEPMFVVCNTPAHQKRKSRHANTFMITFQPRWVFEDINGSTKRGRHIQDIVRSHLYSYDDVLPHPSLKWYGEKGSHEWKQYFLYDHNEPLEMKCPFHMKGDNMETKIQQNFGGKMLQVIEELLPKGKTGSVEVQRDLPYKAHKPHTHPNDEVLHIVAGSLTFTVDNVKYECGEGDRISLQKNSLHSSVAGPEGCTYIISVLD
nr:YqcI/YcgG family protein [Geomicrobium sediminis]